MRQIARALIWIGIALTLLMGNIIPNDYDMLYLMGGLFIMTTGLVLFTTTRSR